MALKSFSRQNLRNKSAVAAVVGSASLPVINAIVICDSNYNDLDDSALNPAGGYAKIVGNNFEAGTIAYFNGTVLTTTFVSSRELRIQTPVITTGSYNLMLFNLSNGQGAIFLNLSVSNFPTITTSANTVLDEEYETKAISASIAATGDTPITFSIVPGEGSLPEGVTLSANGTLSGIAPVVGSTTTYSFVVQAKDAQKQDSTRQFSLTVKTDVVDWVSPNAGATVSAYEYTPFANIGLSATSRAGYGVSFSSNNLPSGLTVTGNTIVGTSNTAGSTNVSIVATSSNTNKTATRNINVVVNPDVVSWSSPANNAVISAYEYTAFSPTSLSATSAAGFDVTYDVDQLPAGLSVDGDFITGTSNVVGNTATTLTATANTTNRNATRNVQFVVNPDAVTFSSPTPGSVFTAYEYTPFANVTLSATSAAGFNVSYDVGTLPAGLSVTGNTISGTSNVAGNTTTTITATANTTGRTATSNVEFVVAEDVVTWSSPANGATISTTTNQPISNVALVANSAAGFGVTYTANGLPTGVTLANGVISGTPTVSGENPNTTLVATASTTGRTATRYIYWTINISGDSFWKNVGLLLGGTDSTSAKPFIHDDSVNNTTLMVAGDIKPSNFSPYEGNGYYSVSHSGTPDYISVPHNSNFSLTSGQTDTLIVEGWFYFNAVTAQTSLFDKSGVSGTSFANWTVFLNASKQVTLQWGVSGSPGTSTVGLLNSTTVPVVGKWYHIAFVKSNADWAVFVDGTRVITYNGLNTAGDANPSALRIGYGIQGGSNGAHFNGHISNVRAWRGTSGAPYSATSATLAVPTSPLTAIAGTILLSHQSARLVDVSSAPATLTLTGANLKVSQAIPFTSNPSTSTLGSAYFDGSGDYLSVPSSSSPAFGTGDFTVQFWVYPTVNARQDWFDCNTNSPRLLIYYNGTNIVYYSTSNRITGGAMVLNTWQHIALSRASGSTRLFINGQQTGNTFPDTINYTSSEIVLGKDSAGSTHITGFMSDVHVVKGTALYTAGFPVPTSPLTAVSNTSLLTLQYNGGATNNGFVDQSGFNNIITRNGNPTQGTFSPYSQTGWSNYYPALAHSTYAANPITSFGTGATFTVEGWVNMAVYPATNYHFSLLASCDQGTATYWAIGIGSTGLATVYWYDGNAKQCTGSTTLVRGEWYHVAVVVTSGVVKIFVNGNVETLSGTTTLTNPTGNASYTTGTERGASNGGSAGHISNLRMCTAAAYSVAFTPSTSPLTSLINGSINSTLLTAQSNRFVDNSNSARTITLGSTRPTVQAYSPFGGIGYDLSVNGGSVYFDGTGDYLSTATGLTHTDLTQGDFTIEAWVYNMGAGAERYIYSQRGASSGWEMRINSTNTLSFFYVTGTTFTSAKTIPPNAWTHVAAVRIGTALSMYINGEKDNTGSGTISNGTVASGSYGVWLGNSTSAGGGLMLGHIADARLIKGTGIYTSNFPPPTSALSAVPGTTYLVNGTSGGIIDYHGSNNLETVGNTQLSSRSPYSGASAGKSLYFDGTGDSLKIIDNPIINFGSGDFTIECWVYFNVVNAQMTIINKGWNSSSPYASYLIWMTSAGSLNFLASSNGSAWNIANERVIGTMTAGVWTHIAVTRTGTTFRAFVNGVINDAFTFTSSASLANIPAQTLFIGDRTNGDTSMNGYIKDLRITKGVARTITVPNAPLPLK